MKYFSVILLAITFLITSLTVHASDSSSADQFLSRLDSLLEKPVPNLSQIIPEYTRPSNENKSLIVGVFSNESDDRVNWGLLLSEMIRVNLHSLPEDPVDIGILHLDKLKYDARSINYRGDKAVDLTDYKNLVTLGKRYGIEKILSGSIKNVNQFFTINLRISNATTNEITNKHFSFEQKELKNNLPLMLEWIYLQLGSNNVNDLIKIRKFGPDNIDLLDEFSPILQSIYLDKQTRFPKLLIEMLKEETNFPTAQFHQIIIQPAGQDVLEHNNEISKIAIKYPNSQAIQSVAAISFWHLNRPGLMQKNILNLQNNIVSSSVEYSSYLALTGVFINYRNSLDAIAVAREEIIRWPHRHRSWWQLSYAVEKLAWQYRGNSFWRDTPEKGKLFFKQLIDFSKDAIDVEIKLHPYSGGGYGNRISLHIGYSDEMYQDFLKGIQYDPLEKYIYNKALNFSGPKWGGSVTTQNKIYQLAVENRLPKNQLNDLWLRYIEPNKNDPAVLLQNFASKMGLPDIYSIDNYMGFLSKNKYISSSFVIIFLFLLFLFFTRRSKIRRHQQNLITLKYEELNGQIDLLQKKWKRERKNLIIEKHEAGFILPQIEQYYFVIFESNGLKIDSHFGIINGDIEEASSTMNEVIQSGIKKLFQ